MRIFKKSYSVNTDFPSLNIEIYGVLTSFDTFLENLNVLGISTSLETVSTNLNVALKEHTAAHY